MSGLSDSGAQTNLHAAALENLRLSLGMRWHLGEGFHLALLLGTEKRTIRFRDGGTDGEVSQQTATRGGLGLTYAW